MGFDPISWAVIGLTVASSLSNISNANKQAKATVAEGEIVAANKAKEVKAKVARQQVSFLSSGVTLEGTPQSVIDSTYQTGLEDIGQIRTNYNRTSKNIIAEGRTKALQGFASAGINFASGGGFGSLSSASSSATRNIAGGANDPFGSFMSELSRPDSNFMGPLPR